MGSAGCEALRNRKNNYKIGVMWYGRVLTSGRSSSMALQDGMQFVDVHGIPTHVYCRHAKSANSPFIWSSREALEWRTFIFPSLIAFSSSTEAAVRCV